MSLGLRRAVQPRDKMLESINVEMIFRTMGPSEIPGDCAKTGKGPEK